MDFAEFAKAWVTDHREPTINGYTISSCNTGVETTLFDQLCNTNITIYFVVPDLLSISDERLKVFASLAHQMLKADIDSMTAYIVENGEENYDLAYIEACTVIANVLRDRFEDIYEAEEKQNHDPEYPWFPLTKSVIDDFGGIPAAFTAVALGGIALATILIRARQYQYAWCAVVGVQSLVSFAEGNLLSDKLSRNRYAELGRYGATRRHAPMKNLQCWAISKYQEKKWQSANQAAHALKDDVISHGKTIGAILKSENAQRTIAEWFRKSV